MRHKYFMDDETLMVEIHCDVSNTVTRPATAGEAADYEEHMEWQAVQDELAGEPSDDPEDGTPMPAKKAKAKVEAEPE